MNVSLIHYESVNINLCDTFVKKWKSKYLSMVKGLGNNNILFSFYDYPNG